MHKQRRWTTNVVDRVYNIYPIYDWLTEDIWRYHAAHEDHPHNEVYDRMHQAGVPLSQQRLCQPFGDDQRRGLWLYHILEPQTWFKLIARVNGANSGSLYIKETGSIKRIQQDCQARRAHLEEFLQPSFADDADQDPRTLHKAVQEVYLWLAPEGLQDDTRRGSARA